MCQKLHQDRYQNEVIKNQQFDPNSYEDGLGFESARSMKTESDMWKTLYENCVTVISTNILYVL